MLLVFLYLLRQHMMKVIYWIKLLRRVWSFAFQLLFPFNLVFDCSSRLFSLDLLVFLRRSEQKWVVNLKAIVLLIGINRFWSLSSDISLNYHNVCLWFALKLWRWARKLDFLIKNHCLWINRSCINRPNDLLSSSAFKEILYELSKFS